MAAPKDYSVLSGYYLDAVAIFRGRMGAYRPLFWLPLIAFGYLLCSAVTDPAAAREKGDVPVLLYHQISTLSHPIPLSDSVIDLALFSRQMQFLHDAGYRTIGTAEMTDLMRKGSDLPDNAVVIHFDDGWRSVLAALPVLEKYGFRATFWVIVEMVGRPDYLDWGDIMGIAHTPAYEVYSHTMSHSGHEHSDLVNWSIGNPPGKSMADVNWELRESKRILEARLGRPVPFLAWPYGEYNDTLVKAAVQAGYTGLFTVDWGLNRSGGDVFRMPRSFVSGLCGLDTFQKVLEDGHSRTCPQAQTTGAGTDPVEPHGR